MICYLVSSAAFGPFRIDGTNISLFACVLALLQIVQGGAWTLTSLPSGSLGLWLQIVKALRGTKHYHVVVTERVVMLLQLSVSYVQNIICTIRNCFQSHCE